jgi:hypothetical protein
VKRIPKWEQVAPVYAVIVMTIYSWSLLHFFWKLSSWIYFSSVGEIAVIFAYMTVVNFIESLLTLLVPVVMSLVLPPKWFCDRFVTKGTLLVLLGLGYLMYFSQTLRLDSPFPYAMVQWMPVIAVAIFILISLADKIGFLNKVLEELANRFVVFLYILIPVSIVSLLTVLVRNIF